MTLNDLTVNFEHLKSDEVLSDWRWLIGSSKNPVLLSASGDAFIQDINDGTVYCLDTAVAEIHKVANSIDEFQQLLSDKEFVVNYFAVKMVGDLIKSNINLQNGQIYTFITPPVLGGEYTLENVEVTDIEIHFSLLGQIHNQIRNLPDGTPISEIKIVSE